MAFIQKHTLNFLFFSVLFPYPAFRKLTSQKSKAFFGIRHKAHPAQNQA